MSFRPFFLVSAEQLAAKQTFEAVFGELVAAVLGRRRAGGVAAAALFVEVAVSRFEKTGQRAFVSNGQAFPLGIPLTATNHAARSLGRLSVPGLVRAIIPYGGAGIGPVRLRRDLGASPTAARTWTRRHAGFLVLGGVEFRAHRWVGVSVDVQYTQRHGHPRQRRHLARSSARTIWAAPPCA